MAKKKTKVIETKVEPEQVEPVQEVPTEQPEAALAQKLDNLIGRVYLITKTGIQLLEGADAAVSIKTIQEKTQNEPNGDMEYVFYENGTTPVYVAIQNGTLEPMAFPEPGNDIIKGQMGMTSMYLYALAVTLAHTIERIVELETSPKPSLIDQARKIMTPTIVIVGCVLAIFLLAVMMKG